MWEDLEGGKQNKFIKYLNMMKVGSTPFGVLCCTHLLE